MFAFGIALLIAGALVIVAEIQSLTIYLIAVALACFVAGGLAASGRAGLDLTLAAFGLVLLAGLPLAHLARRRLRNPESDLVSHDDVGAMVEVISVRNGMLRVSYRGAEWDARAAGGELPSERMVPGARLTIVERDGNTLVVCPPDTAAAGGA